MPRIPILFLAVVCWAVIHCRSEADEFTPVVASSQADSLARFLNPPAEAVGADGAITEYYPAQQLPLVSGEPCEGDSCLEHPVIGHSEYDYFPTAESYRVRSPRSRFQLEYDLIALTYDGRGNFRSPSNMTGETFGTGDYDTRFDAGLSVRMRYGFISGYFAELGWVSDISIAGVQYRPTASGLASIHRDGSYSQINVLLGHEWAPRYQMPILRTRLFGLLGVGGVGFNHEHTGFANTDLENRLWGVTTGLRTYTRHSPVSSTQLNVFGGVYENQARLQSAGGTNGTQSLPSGIAETQGTAFAGHVSWEYQYSLNQSWYLQAGYHMHWILNIGLADENASRNLDTSVASLEVGGNALLHGPSLGLTWIP